MEIDEGSGAARTSVDAVLPPNGAPQFELFSAAFCGACRVTRSVLTRAAQLVPGATLVEHDIAFEPDLAADRGIEATPTVIVRDSAGTEVFRASGVPTIDQVLSAAVLALPPADATA